MNMRLKQLILSKNKKILHNHPVQSKQNTQEKETNVYPQLNKVYFEIIMSTEFEIYSSTYEVHIFKNILYYKFSHPNCETA